MPHTDLIPAAAPPPADALGLASTLRARTAVDPGADPKTVADALLDQLRRDRLIWAVAPIERGGLGLGLADAARVTVRLAKTSGSLGLIYAMHLSQALSLLRHGAGSPYLTAFTDRLIRDQALVASGTSEKSLGGDILRSVCAVEAGPDGALQVVKESPNISYMDHAQAVLVTAMRAEAKGRPTQVVIAAETARMELRPGRDARMMGMQGILNRPYAFTAHFGPEAIFADPHPVIARETMTPSIHVLWAALWSGLASHALGKAKAFLTKEAGHGEGAELMWAELSRLANRHYQMNALIREAARDFDEPPASADPAMALARTARVKRLKIVCSEVLQDVCQGALGLIGLRGYAEDGPYSLSEVIRDALSARVMISNYRLLLNNGAIERFVEDEL